MSQMIHTDLIYFLFTDSLKKKKKDMLFAKLQILTIPFPLPVMIWFV